jgi:hypothetical protein
MSDYFFNYFKLTLGIIQESYVREKARLTFSIIRLQVPLWIFIVEISATLLMLIYFQSELRDQNRQTLCGPTHIFLTHV